MHFSSYDSHNIVTAELPRYSSVDVQKAAPTGPKKERGPGIKQHMPYFVNDSKGRVKPGKGGHKGLGYVRKSAEEEAASAERKMGKGKSRGANPNANPLLQPIAFVKGTSSWDKDMDLSKIKMAAETKDAEDVFVQIPTEQAADETVDQTVDTSAAEDLDGEEEDVSKLLYGALDTSNVTSSAAESTSTAGEEEEEEEKETQQVKLDSSMPSISKLNIEESSNADSSLGDTSLINTSVADTSIQTVTEPNATRNDIEDDEEIEDQMVDNDDLFIVDSNPSEIPASLKPKDPAAIVVKERVEDAEDVDISANPHHSFSRSDIVEVEEPVLSSVPEKKNSKLFTAMQNDNLFKDVQELGQMFASGNKPTFEDFTFSPQFNSQKKNKKDKKNKNKGEKMLDEPLEPRVGDSDLEWGSDGPPAPKNKHSKKTNQPKKPTLDDELVADWLENTRQGDSDDESGGETAAGPLGADDTALRSFVNSMSKNQDTITDLKIDKRLRKEAREEAELDSDSSSDSDEMDSEFEKAEDFKFGFSDNDSLEIEDEEIYLDSSLSSEEAYELGRARAKAAKSDGVVSQRDRKGKIANKGKKRAEDFLDDYDELMEFDDFEGKHNKWDEEEQFLDELAAIIENKKQNLQKAKSSSRQGSRQGKYSYDDYGDVYGDDDEDSEDDFALDPRDLIFPTSRLIS